MSRLYAVTGRPSIPPERLLRALLLQIFYSIRSERLLMEQLNYNLLFRWFVGLLMDDPIWDATVFTKNRGLSAARNLRMAYFRYDWDGGKTEYRSSAARVWPAITDVWRDMTQSRCRAASRTLLLIRKIIL